MSHISQDFFYTKRITRSEARVAVASMYRMETLMKHALTELHKIAVRFEEKIYTAAISQVHLT